MKYTYNTATLDCFGATKITSKHESLKKTRKAKKILSAVLLCGDEIST